MQKRTVDEVEEWLRVNDMIEYFVEHGWDKLAVIAEMTEKDIEMCIQKPGHKVKLKKAIAVLRDNHKIDSNQGMDKKYYQISKMTANTECSNPSSGENSHQDSKRTSVTESMLSSGQTYSNKSEDTQSSIHSLHVSKSCSHGGSKSSTTKSQLDPDIKHAIESVDVINMDIPNKPEGPISIPDANQNCDKDDHDHGQIVPCVDDQNSDINMERYK